MSITGGNCKWLLRKMKSSSPTFKDSEFFKYLGMTPLFLSGFLSFQGENYVTVQVNVENRVQTMSEGADRDAAPNVKGFQKFSGIRLKSENFCRVLPVWYIYWSRG